MIKKRKHSRWVELYRPETLEDYLGNESVIEKIKEDIENNDIPHYIFHGTPGTGKSSLAKVIVKTLDCDYIYINASDENGIDTIREKVKEFASSASFKPLKVVILDEADFLTINAQKALLNIIETYALSTRFILTCNYKERLEPALVSRCEVRAISAQTKGDIAKHVCSKILDVEGVKYNLKDVATIINQHYPDVRSVIKDLQKFTVKKQLKLQEFESLYTTQILTELSKPTSKSWSNIRKIMADNHINEYQTLYRFLFDNMDKFSNGNDAVVAITIDEFMWKANSVPDKEINGSAFFARILQIINPD